MDSLGLGGGKITDVTATPEKVFSGEVFYNNEGRQVGTYSSTIEVKSIYIPPHSMQYLDFSIQMIGLI